MRKHFYHSLCISSAAVLCGCASGPTADSNKALDDSSPGVLQPEQTAPQSGAESRTRFTPDELMGSLGQQLIAGLNSTPGCLGADAASFASGRLVIFGWFTDKEAALAWHDSEIHKQVSTRFSGGRIMNRTPLEHIPANVPLMVIASVAMEPQTDANPPRMMFGIEVYEPMPGGFSFQGGAFLRPSFKNLWSRSGPTLSPRATNSRKPSLATHNRTIDESSITLLG